MADDLEGACELPEFEVVGAWAAGVDWAGVVCVVDWAAGVDWARVACVELVGVVVYAGPVCVELVGVVEDGVVEEVGLVEVVLLSGLMGEGPSGSESDD